MAVSAAIQLSSLSCLACHPTANLELPPALIARTERFFGDDLPLLAEVMLLADHVGMLDDPTPEALLTRLAEPVRFTSPPALTTETPDERAAILERLSRLERDGRLRRRFVALLNDLWESFAPRWEGGARERAQAVADEWTRQRRAGVSLFALLPDLHIARREPYATMAREAERAGRLHLAPTMAGMGHILDLPSCMSISAAPAAVDPVVGRRAAAETITAPLKALAEPTRITILVQLAAQPASVGTLARTLHISQPTASVHLRRLREAGLVEAHRDGASSVYSARPQAVQELLETASKRLASAMARPAP